MAPRRDKALERSIATQRVERLLGLAERAALAGGLADASRYGQLAWRITTRYKLRGSPKLKARVCRKCKGYLLPGRTARARVHGGKVSTTCLSCGTVRRLPLTRERRARRGSLPSRPQPVPQVAP